MYDILKTILDRQFGVDAAGRLIFQGSPIAHPNGALPLGKPQIVTTRSGIFNSIRQGTAGSRTDVRIENRQKYYVGRQPVSQLRVMQAGFYMKNDSTGEHVMPNDYTWEVALEITSPAMYQSLFTFGSKTPTVVGGAPFVTTDTAIGIDVAAGGSILLRQAVSVATDTLYIPSSSNPGSATDSGYISPSTDSQVAALGAMTDPGSGTAFGGPQAIIVGVPSAPMEAVCIVGDSIADNTGDSVDSHGNIGFVARGLDSVNGYPVPYIKTTVGSDKFSQNTLDVSPRKRSVWPLVTHIVFAIGTNDVSAGASLSTVQAYLTDLLTAAKRTVGPYGKPLQTAAVKLMPRVTSTDSYATVANQTPVSGFARGGVRDQYNSWLDSIAGRGLLDAVIDPNVYVEAGSGKWIANGNTNYATTDGIHPTSAVHILAAQAVTNWAKTIKP